MALFYFSRTPTYLSVNSPRPFHGSQNASIVIQEFSDFQCPACYNAFFVLKQIASEYKDKVKLEFHHFPLDFHPLAFDAALAAECANDKGKFFEYAEEVFLVQKTISKSKLYSIAKKLGLDKKQFKACLKSEAKSSILYKDIGLGRQKGLRGTPTIYLNGKEISNWGYESLKSEIDKLYEIKNQTGN